LTAEAGQNHSLLKFNLYLQLVKICIPMQNICKNKLTGIKRKNKEITLYEKE
jgi:hypothetical protein